MANFRPEFYYHPAVGVISPTSLDLVKFKSDTFSFAPPSSLKPAPLKIKPAPQSLPVMETAPLAVTVDLPPLEKEDMRKKPLEDIETCIVTGDELPTDKMVKFVLNPDGEIVPDLNNKLPGVAFYVTAHRDIIKKAVWRNSFASVARETVVIPKNLMEMLGLALLKQSLDMLALAKKAGQLTHGFAKVEEALRAHTVRVYVVANDAKENGRQKLEKKLTGSTPVLETWTGSQLSAVLGEDNVIHAAILDGGQSAKLADKILKIAKKLENIR